jgi:hypothetical protein
LETKSVLLSRTPHDGDLFKRHQKMTFRFLEKIVVCP